MSRTLFSIREKILLEELAKKDFTIPEMMKYFPNRTYETLHSFFYVRNIKVALERKPRRGKEVVWNQKQK